MSTPEVEIERVDSPQEGTDITINVDGETAVDVTVDEDGHIEIGARGTHYTRLFGPDDDADTCAIIDGDLTSIIENYDLAVDN